MEKINLCEAWEFSRGQNRDKTETVNLPHDAMITERRGPHAPSGAPGGYFYGDVYYYKKTLNVPDSWSDKNVTLEFEAIYHKATVYINGEKAKFQAYGYSNFYVDLDKYLKYGSENVISVEVNNTEMKNSRWYSGSGIYRPVYLYVRDKDDIEINGIEISTVSVSPAKIRVKTDMKSSEVSIEITKDGKCVATATGKDVLIDIPNAKLWSCDTPEMYECTVNGVTEKFGIRMIEWNENGFFVNGVSTLLRGACVHHDNGILGAACVKEAEYRKVRILKENGYNAIRSAHNPCSKYMLEACDKYGMYMVDEIYDMWFVHKSPYDNADCFEETWQDDVRAMVYKDINHPSVIMYSLVNEPSETSSKRGLRIEKEMSDFIKAIDTTRAVTAGINPILATASVIGVNAGYSEKNVIEDSFDENGNFIGEKKEPKALNGSFIFNMAFGFFGPFMNYLPNNPLTTKIVHPIFDNLDIGGYNYGFGRYGMDAKRFKGKLIYGSETLPMDIYRNWSAVKKYPHVIGDFMWTGWDYLGEVGAGGWSYVDDGIMMNKHYPWLIADVGAIDLIGNPGAECRYASTVWEQNKGPIIVVNPVNHPGVKPRKTMWRGTNAIESWSWKNCEGNEAEVYIYSSAAMVELFINGRSLGIKSPEKCKALYTVKYEPGTVTAVEYTSSLKEIARTELYSAKSELKVSLVPEKDAVHPSEVFFVNVDISDENGVIESNSDMTVDIAVENGKLLAFGSAVQSTEERYHTGHFPTYYGRALAVVEAGSEGKVKIESKSSLGTSSCILDIK